MTTKKFISAKCLDLVKLVLISVIVAVVVGAVSGLVIVYLIESDDSSPYSIRSLETGGSPSLGSTNAPLTMIEWGDYQCTYCYRFHQTTLDTLKEEYVDTGLLRIIFRDFPLNGPESVLAAHASRCAEEQNMFWSYHDILYENWGGERTGWITRAALYGFALDTNLNTSHFTECMDSGRHTDSINAEYTRSQDMGISATPSFIIHNGEKAVRVVGNQPYSVFESILDEMLQ